MYDNHENGENKTTPDSQYRYSGPFYEESSTYGGMGGKKPKKKSKFGALIAKTVVVALVFGCVGSGAFQATNYLGKQLLGTEEVTGNTEPTQIGVVPQVSTTGSTMYQGDVSSIVGTTMPSVVAITNVGVTEVQSIWGGFGFGIGEPQTQESTSTGTGIIIGQNDTELLIVTNDHVVSGATDLSVVFSVDEDKEESQALQAQLKGSDATKDIAVIAVSLESIPEETKSEIKIATLGDSSDLQVGEQVIAIGNALGYGQSVTTGIISALNRNVELVAADGSSITNNLIQTDAAINPGNSGGALLNMQGEVIGINEAKYASDEVEGIGYAIPISDVSDLIGDLETMETRTLVAEEDLGYLGITCQDVSADIAEAYNMPEGVFIKSVVPNCGAAQAGLQEGYILTNMGGLTIRSYSDLQERLKYYAAGEVVEVTYQAQSDAGYVEKTAQVTLSSAQKVQENQ